MRRKCNRRQVVQTAAMLAFYGALFAVLIFSAVRSARSTDSVFGSMEGRFDSNIQMELEGATYRYRESEITNYLVMGVDRENSTDGGQADFLLLLSVDRRNGSVWPLMIDRDTMASVTTYGIFFDASGEKQMQICLAQAFHGRGGTGSENTVEALSRLLCGAPIDHYVALDMDGIALLNDAVGGVEVTLEDDFTAFDPAMKPGSTVLLKGQQAQWFVRGRMDVSDGTNTSRMRRQRTYLESLLSKIAADGGLEEVSQALSGHMETDMTQNEMLEAWQSYGGYALKAFEELPGEHRVSEDGFVEFWLDEEQVQKRLAEMWFRENQ